MIVVWVLMLCWIHGMREGFTFANEFHRKNNIFVYHKGYGNNGIFSYHQLRFAEYMILICFAYTFTFKSLLLFGLFFPVYELTETYIPRSNLSFKDMLTYQKDTWSFGSGFIKRPYYWLKYVFSVICGVLYVVF